MLYNNTPNKKQGLGCHLGGNVVVFWTCTGGTPTAEIAPLHIAHVHLYGDGALPTHHDQSHVAAIAMKHHNLPLVDHKLAILVVFHCHII